MSLPDVPEDLNKAYQNFFLKSVHGQYFMAMLDHLIDSEHEQAEKDGEAARDHTQRAKGVRQVLDHISSASIERRQPR